MISCGPCRLVLLAGDLPLPAPVTPAVLLALRPASAAPPPSDAAIRSSSGWLRRSPGGWEGEALDSAEARGRLVRFAVASELLPHGWLLLHAASVRLRDGVHVFVAPSGTGKTTLARRVAAAGGELLGDEVAAVGPGECAVFPFQPMPGAPGASGALAAIHLLGRGEPSMRRVRPASAAARLLGATMLYEDLPGGAAMALDAAVRIAGSAPVFETAVPDDDRAARLFGAAS